MNIEININRLILEGLNLAHRDRPLLQTAVEAELTRLLSEGGLNRQTNIALLDVPADQIQVSGNNDPAQLGRQIARSVYTGLNGQAGKVNDSI